MTSVLKNNNILKNTASPELIGTITSSYFSIKSFGTGKISDEKLTEIAKSVFALKPGEIIQHLNLKYPRYRQTAANGHFGREHELFTWEKTDKVDDIKSAVSERK